MIEHHDQKGYLRFAINLGNPVLTTLLPDGSPGGITVELAKKLAAESQREARFVTWPTAGQVVDAALQDQWDIAFLAIDPAREDKLRFTPSYVTIESSLMVKKESQIQSVQEMDRAGAVINVGKGAAYELYLIRNAAACDDAPVRHLTGGYSGVHQRRRRLGGRYSPASGESRAGESAVSRSARQL